MGKTGTLAIIGSVAITITAIAFVFYKAKKDADQDAKEIEDAQKVASNMSPEQGRRYVNDVYWNQRRRSYERQMDSLRLSNALWGLSSALRDLVRMAEPRSTPQYTYVRAHWRRVS